MSYIKTYVDFYPDLLTWQGRALAKKNAPYNLNDWTEKLTPDIKEYLSKGVLSPQLDFAFQMFGEGCIMARNYEQVNNHYKRASRLRVKVASLIESKQAVFFTLTFTDAVLASTTTETRHKYVIRWLERYLPDFVANVDFSPKTGREHYHGISPVAISKEAREAWNAYGSINFERIRNRGSDASRTAKYITKLSQHAMKESCGHCYRVIYPRKKQNQ